MPLAATLCRLALAGAVALSGPAPAAAAGPQPPGELIEELDRLVLGELRVRGTELDRNPDRLFALAREKVRPHFDLEHAARLVLGSLWRESTPAQRARFVAAFEDYLVASYARALLFVEPETLTVLGPPKVIDSGGADLPIRIVMHDGDEIEAEVRFRLSEGAWRIWDIRASGISFVRQYRGDIGTEAHIRGLDQCIESLGQVSRRMVSDLRRRLRETRSIRAAY